uniref:Uncharacterized protein n=1 Tax=Ditylenchus dipsaci TaxID=166011 RepID=A0A915EIZ5_9BILA
MPSLASKPRKFKNRTLVMVKTGTFNSQYCSETHMLVSWLMSSAFAAAPPYGQLSVSGTKLKGSNGQNVQLRGLSLFWSQWMGQYYNAGTVQALKCSWNANWFVLQWAAIDQGIYVIIDWHAHDNYQSQAVSFFIPYHTAVIKAIRQYDTKNVIILGTRPGVKM